MKNKKRLTVLFISLCLCFAIISTASCTLKSSHSSTDESTWSDGNVDDNGWT